MNYENARKAAYLLQQKTRGEIELDYNREIHYKLLVKKASKDSFFFFAKHVLQFQLLTEATHKRWAEDLQKDFWEYDYFMRIKPRKSFKTTLYAEAFILWLWVVISPALHIFYTSANGTLIEEVSSHLDHYIGFEATSLYSELFGIRRDMSMTPNTVGTMNIVGKDPSVKGSSLMFRTAGGSVNGVHPHIIIVDDPMDNNDRESPAIRRKKERWFDSLFPLLHGYDHNGVEISKLMVITTRWHMDDLVSYIEKKNSEITVKTERFHIEVEGVYQEDGSLQYPEFFNEDQIRKIRQQMSNVFFACQYLNNPLPEGLQVFDKSRMHFFTFHKSMLEEGRRLCLLDPAKGSKEGDYPAVIWVSYHRQTIRIMDAIDKKIQISDMLKLIAKKNIKYGIPEMVYESNGTLMLKKAILDAHKAIDRNYKISVHEYNERRNKNERIINMQPQIYNGTVTFRDDYSTVYPECMNQIFYYPAWGHDDFPDIVEKSVKILAKSREIKAVSAGINM